MHKFQILHSYCPQNCLFLDVCYDTLFQYPKSESRKCRKRPVISSVRHIGMTHL